MSSDLIDDDDYDPTPPAGTRWGVALGIVLFHVVVIAGLIRAFTPDIAAKVMDRVLTTFNVTVYTPPPSPPPPPPPPSARPERESGKAGNAGKQAIAKETKALDPKVKLSQKPAPRASNTGSADTSGAANQGAGTGAQGQGTGPGAGGLGNGPGGGRPSKPVHISGNITNAREFPIPPGGREARIGKSVILELTISPQGRAVGCKVYRSSGFPETDAKACELAMKNLRFKPATNAQGQPVQGIFHWQQRFKF